MPAEQRPPPAVYASLALAALWLGAAWAWPATTWHGLPLLVAAGVAAGYRLSGSGPLSPAAALGTSVSGLTNALVATGILILFDRLKGEALLISSASLEAVGWAILGAGLGYLIARAGASAGA